MHEASTERLKQKTAILESHEGLKAEKRNLAAALQARRHLVTSHNAEAVVTDSGYSDDPRSVCLQASSKKFWKHVFVVPYWRIALLAERSWSRQDFDSQPEEISDGAKWIGGRIEEDGRCSDQWSSLLKRRWEQIIYDSNWSEQARFSSNAILPLSLVGHESSSLSEACVFWCQKVFSRYWSAAVLTECLVYSCNFQAQNWRQKGRRGITAFGDSTE